MNTKPIDKSKKSNIKCDHCANFIIDKGTCGWIPGYGICQSHKCLLTNKGMNYWQKCKDFQWDETKNYKEEV